MKKALMSILIIILLMVILCTCTGCYSCNGLFTDDNDDDKKDYRLYTDYFEYYILFGEATITNTTELGVNQDYLVIPDEIDGYPVTDIYYLSLGYHYDKTAQAYRHRVKKVFVSKNVELFSQSLMDDINTKFIIMSQERPTKRINITYHISKHHTKFYGDVEIANLTYLLNYNEAPNTNVYFVDDLEEGECIEYMPNSPQREGYVFTGWYLDENCTEKVELDTYIYHEETGFVDFYAGWEELQ